MTIDIRVTDIGEYVNQDSCAMKFKLRADKTQTNANYPYYNLVRSAINPALVEAGEFAETEVAELLENKYKLKFLPYTNHSRGVDSTDWHSFLNYLKNLKEGENVFLREVEISGSEGAFTLFGQMDFVIITWVNGEPLMRILECKASRKDKTYHKIQLASYLLLIKEKFREGVNIANQQRNAALEAVVVRVEGHTGIQDPLTLPPLHLETEMLDLQELLAEDGPLYAAYNADFADIDYSLGAKCNTCTHSAICTVESIRGRKVELLGLPISENRALRAAGIETLDDLTELNLEKFAELRRNSAFKESISRLRMNAQIKTAGLLGGSGFLVQMHESNNISALPDHLQGEERLIRVYLDVEWDPIEDRLLGVAAHVTDSDNFLYLENIRNGDRRYLNPQPLECNARRNKTYPLNAEEAATIVEEPWHGVEIDDDQQEKILLEEFFSDLSTMLLRIGRGGTRAVHFYVWSEFDMRHLIDGCKRAGGEVLGNLVELLGCRADCTHDLEQVIFSSLAEEIKRRVAIGKVSQSLTSVTSLNWFGWTFHWNRSVKDEEVNFQQLFRQDIFDLIAKLEDKEGRLYSSSQGQYYEVRVRNDSAISIPYWHMMWDPETKWKISDSRAHAAMNHYRKAGRPEYIQEFMKAKCQALRWLDERLMPRETASGKRQPSLVSCKPPLELSKLSSLQEEFKSRYTLKQACLDFLKLDHHLREAEWLSYNTRSTFSRVVEGSCLPLREIRFEGSGRDTVMYAQLDLDRYDLDTNVFSGVCEFEKTSFVRIIPYSGETDSVDYSVKRGVTAIITKLDFTTGEVEAAPFIRDFAGSYVMASRITDFDGYDLGIAVASLSDFTKEKVAKWLKATSPPVFSWFDPLAPYIPPKFPLDNEDKMHFNNLLKDASKQRLDDSQTKACLDGLQCRVQLLFGPPGTGKTNTMAYAVLLRMLTSEDNAIFLISANTHTAVDELLSRIRQIMPAFKESATRLGNNFVEPALVRLNDLPEAGEINPQDTISAQNYLAHGRTAFCGTVGQLMKLAAAMKDEGFLVNTLIIDEASMMVFPYFLALSSLLDINGDIMLAGDIMQLSPITSYDWNNEQREQIERLKPYQSAYAAVKGLCQPTRDVCPTVHQSALTTTYRMNRECTDLISEIYSREGIDLLPASNVKCYKSEINSLADIWQGKGIYLIIHDEHESKKYNPYEVQLIQRILASKDESEEVAIITPHRAQKSALMKMTGSGIIVDTVERFQGGQCSTVIVSGTQSDSMEISGNAEFILDLNRTNVIFSRAQNRLIVVCSKNLLDSIPSAAEEYENSLLWKRLRALCRVTKYQEEYKGHGVEVRIPR